jgi:uncharacterized protein (TIGR02246 family)
MPLSNAYPPFDRPERIADIWMRAWNRRDADRLAALFEADAEFVNVTGLWWHDRDATGGPTTTASAPSSNSRSSHS